MSRNSPSGHATIEAKQTFLNGLVSALTSGIYTPTTLRVRTDTPELLGSVVEAPPPARTH